MKSDDVQWWISNAILEPYPHNCRQCKSGEFCKTIAGRYDFLIFIKSYMNKLDFGGKVLFIVFKCLKMLTFKVESCCPTKPIPPSTSHEGAILTAAMVKATSVVF